MIYRIVSKVTDFLIIAFLPLLLAVLFVFQNQIFNWQLGLHSSNYFVRLFGATLALGIILYGPSAILRKKYRYWYLLVISLLVSLTFIAQFLYYRYSESFLQFSAIRYFNQAKSILGTVEVLFAPVVLVFLANVVLVLLVWFLSYKFKQKDLILPRWEKTIIILAMAILVILGYQYLLYTEKKEWGSTSRLYTDVYDLKSLVGKVGIANFFLEDGVKYFLRRNLVGDEDRQFLIEFAKQKRSVASQENNSYYGISKSKNLIIIEVESLESAVINRTVDGHEITPNLNRLIKEGLYFDNYYAQVGPGNTADAEFSTMNSLYPLANDVAFINYAKNNYKALPQLLVDKGYKTYTLHGDVPTFWNRSNIYPGLGWQKVFSLSDYTVTRSVGKGPSDLSDEDLFDQSLPRLQSFSEPYMAMLITMSSHTPFILPDDLQTLEIAEKTNLSWIQWQYLQSMHYVDNAIGEFINNLKANGVYDKSMIVIWGDHSSFTNISSELTPNYLDDSTKDAKLYENLNPQFTGIEDPLLDNPDLADRQVPFLILNSGIQHQIISKPASHLDVFPTLSNLFGVTIESFVLGQDLLNTKTPVATLFKLGSGGIEAILTSDLLYRADNSGVFSRGACLSVPGKISLPLTDCLQVYKEQSDILRASNIIIRGNLLSEAMK